MSRRVLLTDATGTLGRQLEPRLLSAGHHVRALSRRSTVSDADADADADDVEWVVGDLRDGSGLDAAVAGVDVILHCASAQRGDVTAAQHLLAAARRAGSPHLVYISIVGVDRVPLGYYKSKLAVERLVSGSGVPFTIVRATQFHDLVLTMFAAQRRLPVLLVPARTDVQPVDAGEVADRLTQLAGSAPAARVPDLGGPEVLDGVDLAHRYLATVGRRRPVLRVHVPGKTGRAYRDGGHLAPEHAAGRITFDQFLAARVSTGPT